MKYAANPIIIRTSSPKDLKLPDGASNLLEEMRRISRGKGVAAPSSRAAMQQDFGGDIVLFEDSFYQDAAPLDLAAQSCRDRVCEIIQGTDDCVASYMDESNWNEKVHKPMFQLALNTRPKSPGNLDCRKIDSATIVPEHRFPISPTDKPANFRVDYGLVLRLEDRDEEKWQSLLPSERSKSLSFNYTESAALVRTPIAVTAETKLPGACLDEAMIQLAVVAFAQYSKFEADFFHVTPPFLPHLIVQGSAWYIAVSWIAASHHNKRTCFLIRQDDPLGHTGSASGITQITAALHRLATWATNEHLPWLRETVQKSVVEKLRLNREAEP